jgi:nitrous oxide reductase accessory protein NosL
MPSPKNLCESTKLENPARDLSAADTFGYNLRPETRRANVSCKRKQKASVFFVLPEAAIWFYALSGFYWVAGVSGWACSKVFPAPWISPSYA